MKLNMTNIIEDSKSLKTNISTALSYLLPFKPPQTPNVPVSFHLPGFIWSQGLNEAITSRLATRRIRHATGFLLKGDQKTLTSE